MTPQLLNTLAISPALSLLPERMDSREARLMLLAICLHESGGLRFRRQVAYYRDGVPVHGPARGFPNFERIGVAGVLEHRASKGPARAFVKALVYPFDAGVLHHACEHNDVLSLGLARLNLWTLPRALPQWGDPKEAFGQYIAVWRPGAYTKGSANERGKLRARWDRNWKIALESIA